MLAYASVLVLSLGCFLISGFLGPKIIGSLPKSLKPQLRIFAWFGGLYALVFSALSVLISSLILVIDSWFSLQTVTTGSSNLGWVVLLSILPWIALGLIGAMLAAVVTRLEPALALARQTKELLRLVGKPVGDFHGLELQVLQVPVLAASLTDGDKNPRILISAEAIELLSEQELEAVYWHELGHAIGQHNGQLRIARMFGTLLPWLPLARVVATAVEISCEDFANQYALEHCDANALSSAQSKFTF
ncbi:MAG: Peptidase family [Actinomycetota bacterium]|jgi:Zn-dependent protease with chaperone function